MPFEIPGYYFDPEKNKYFKIEKSGTAPPAASWSSESVKKRKVEAAAAFSSRQRTRLLRNHIKRHGLTRDVVSSGLLAREAGRRGVVAELEDLGAAAWAGGLVEKGILPFVPSFARERSAHMPCFYVAGENCGSNVGVAYATLDEETLVSTYIATDDNDRIRFARDATDIIGPAGSFHTEMIRCPQISSINYHQPSHRILLTSRETDQTCGVYFFSPSIELDEYERPYWLLGEADFYQRLSIHHFSRDDWLVHKSTTAPPSSDLLCVIGTSSGILRVGINESITWVSSYGNHSLSSSSSQRPQGSFEPSKKQDKHAAQKPVDVFDQDFQVGNHNILLAGGRQPKLWKTDLRTSSAEWTSIRTPSSVAHLRSVNPHQVLVAGLQNHMELYDMRFLADRQAGRPNPNGTTPILTFPEYKNAAHFQTGWDVCPALNVVASAQDNGTVKLFSLRSGRQLYTPHPPSPPSAPPNPYQRPRHSTLINGFAPRQPTMPIHRARNHREDAHQPRSLAEIKSDVPIKALMFQTLPRERLPSLFVTEGAALRKFSFGSRDPHAEE